MTRFGSHPHVDPAFPWGANQPTTVQRVVVAAVIASVAALAHYFRAADVGGLSDFGSVWQGARVLLAGGDPYATIGPGREIEMPWPTRYPAPAFVAAAPFTLLPLHHASTVFTFISTALLAFGVTAGSWHRLAAFPSIAFIASAQLGQWSILFAAALFIPLLSILAVVKPPTSLPVLAAAREGYTAVLAAVGAVVFLSISLLLFPGWPAAWLAVVETSDNFSIPVTRFGGLAILVVGLRWRRPEAWLILAAACTPQVAHPYNSLVLLFIAVTYREACVLSLVSSAGWIATIIAIAGQSPIDARDELWGTMIAFCYLPATIAVLRRSNVGPGPWWAEKFFQLSQRIILYARGR
jgi:hypothetical protein